MSHLLHMYDQFLLARLQVVNIHQAFCIIYALSKMRLSTTLLTLIIHDVQNEAMSHHYNLLIFIGPFAYLSPVTSSYWPGCKLLIFIKLFLHYALSKMRLSRTFLTLIIHDDQNEAMSHQPNIYTMQTHFFIITMETQFSNIYTMCQTKLFALCAL